MTEKIHCSVYRSPRKEGMYVYVPKQAGVEDLPAELLAQFGTPGHVMDLELHEGVKLARVDVAEVLEAVLNQGFYLQMPPRHDPFR